MRGLAVAWALLCACSSGRYAGRGTSGIQPFTLERYDVYLANGLRVVIEPDHRSPVVAMTTVIRTGAASDPAGKSGLAHLCARLTLRVRDDAGLPRRRAFVATAAADASAMADVDDTTLQAIGPSAALPRLLALHAAQLLQPLTNLDPEALAGERTQIERERHARVDTGDPLALVPELRRILFASADIYARAPDGSADGLAAIGPDDVAAFARTYYRAENATLAIVGDVDPAEVQALVTSIYGSPIRGPAPSDADRPPIDLRLPELPAGPQLVTTTANVPTPELLLGWVLPGYYDTSAPSPDLVASAVHRILVEYEWPPPNDIGIVRQAQGQVAPPIFLPERMAPPPPASRSSNWLFDPDLVSLLRAPQEFGPLLMQRLAGLPGVDIDSDIENVEAFAVPAVHATMLVCRIKLREGAHPSQTLENVLDHLRVLWEGKVRQDLFLTRPSLFSQLVLEAEAPSERSRLIASYASFVGGSHALSKRLERLIIPDSRVEHFAWDRLTREQMRAMVVMPRMASSRPQPPVWSLGLPGAPREPSPDVGLPPGVRVLDPATIRSVNLPNGLELIVLRRPGIPIVTVSALLRVGTGGGRPPGVVDTALRITRPGRRYGNPSDFGVVETIDARPDAITIEQEGGAAHLGKMLAMLSDRLRSVTALRADLETFRKYTLPEWRREQHRPHAQADREFWKTLFGDHSYGFRAVAADLARVTVTDVERWVKRTYRPENVILVIAGDLDVDEAERLARTWLGNWTNSSPLPEGGVQVVPELEANEETNAVLVTRNPGSPVGEVRMGCLLPDSVEERDIVAYDLAAEVLAQRLERSLPPAAAATVANDTGRLLGGTTALIVATTVSASAVSDATRDLRIALDDLSRTGPTSLELDEARWSVARRHVLSVATTPATVQAVLETRKRGLSLSGLNRYAARIAITSPDQVMAVFQSCNARKVLSVLADEPLASAAAAEWKQP